MPRVQAGARTQAQARTQASTRTPISIFRVPQQLIDLGVTYLWDWNQGFTGANGAQNMDRIDGRGMGYRGTTAIASVYTLGEYSIDLERNNSDYFQTPTRGQVYTNAAVTLFGWVKRESISNTMNILSQWETVTANRSSFIRIFSDNTIDLSLSSNGTLQTIYRSTETLTDASAWHFIALSYDTTNRSRGVLDTSTLTMSLLSGTDPASIFTNSTPFQIGCQSPNTPTNFWDGKIGICGVAIGTSMSPATMQILRSITNSIGRYV